MAAPQERRRTGRPRKNPDPMAAHAPQHVTQPISNPEPSSGIKLIQSYFSKVRSAVEPGLGYDGTVGDARNYVKHVDRDGNPLPIKFRWGSERVGQAEKNLHAGFVEAKVNPDTMELDPNGVPVIQQGTRGWARHLLVRQTGPGSWDERRESYKAERTQRMMKKQKAAALEELAGSLSVHENLTVQLDERVETTSGYFDAGPDYNPAASIEP